jgi:hypothetical protein
MDPLAQFALMGLAFAAIAFLAFWLSMRSDRR